MYQFQWIKAHIYHHVGFNKRGKLSFNSTNALLVQFILEIHQMQDFKAVTQKCGREGITRRQTLKKNTGKKLSGEHDVFIPQLHPYPFIKGGGDEFLNFSQKGMGGAQNSLF